MSNIDCVICFEKLNVSVRCSTSNCTTEICTECLVNYLKICKNDKQIPKCPGCKSQYFISNISHISNQDTISYYLECCLLELVTEKGDNVRKELEISNKIDKLREERRVFVEKKFPNAIYFTASLVLSNRLKKIDKQIINKVEEQSKQSKRNCMNLMCKGFLDQRMVCITCETSFCPDCDKKLTGTFDHVCDPNDVASVEIVKQTIKCPTCFLPIFKSSGCNNMTCAHCGEKFLYDSGVKGGAGNHSKGTNVDVRNKIFLSVEYHDYLFENDFLQKVLEIEHLEPSSNITFNSLQKILLKYYSNDEHLEHKEMLSLSRKYELYSKRLSKFKRYIRMTLEIEEKILNKTLTGEFLEEVEKNI